MNFQFVVLGYTREIQAERGVDIAIAIKRLDSAEEPGITLETTYDWRTLVDAEDIPYLEAVFAELRGVPQNESEETISRLQELSTGCLRTNATGTCDESSLPLLAHSTSI